MEQILCKVEPAAWEPFGYAGDRRSLVNDLGKGSGVVDGAEVPYQGPEGSTVGDGPAVKVSIRGKVDGWVSLVGEVEKVQHLGVGDGVNGRSE